MPAPIRRVDELGFPLPGSFDDLPDQSAEPSSPKRGWRQFIYRYRWGVLLLLLPILFGSSFVIGAREFVANWLLNKAEVHRERDQMDEALASTNRALFWEPDSFERWRGYSMRAAIYEETQEHLKDCLDDLNEVITRLDDPARSKHFATDLCFAYSQRASVLERLGKHREAVADSTTALTLAPNGTRAMFLNERAYIRALANVELDQALQDVQQSLASNSDDPEVIDTRGYIEFRLGKYEAARKDIERAIQIWTRPSGGFFFQGENGPRQFLPRRDTAPHARRKDREALAVMYHHHGEILKKLGQDPKGDAEIRRAENMGYNPDRGVY